MKPEILEYHLSHVFHAYQSPEACEEDCECEECQDHIYDMQVLNKCFHALLAMDDRDTWLDDFYERDVAGCGTSKQEFIEWLNARYDEDLGGTIYGSDEDEE